MCARASACVPLLRAPARSVAAAMELPHDVGKWLAQLGVVCTASLRPVPNKPDKVRRERAERGGAAAAHGRGCALSVCARVACVWREKEDAGGEAVEVG